MAGPVKTSFMFGGGGGGASNLADLQDVDLTGLQDGYVLIWNDSDNRWEPELPSVAIGGLAAVATTGDYADLTGTQDPSTVVVSGTAQNDIAVFLNGTNELGILPDGASRFDWGTSNGLFLQRITPVEGNNFYSTHLAQTLVDSTDTDADVFIENISCQLFIGNSSSNQIGDFLGRAVNVTTETNIEGGVAFNELVGSVNRLNITSPSLGNSFALIQNELNCFSGGVAQRASGTLNSIQLEYSSFQPNSYYRHVDSSITTNNVEEVILNNTNGTIRSAETSYGYLNTITLNEVQHYEGISLGENIDTIDTYKGIYIAPTIDTVNQNAYCIEASVNDININPGSPSFVTLGDVYFEALEVGEVGPNLEYVGGATAGNENAFFDSDTSTIFIQIENGVSTAQQIADIFNFEFGFYATATPTGNGIEPQVLAGPTQFAGGLNPDDVLAGLFNGNVEINGDLEVFGDFAFEIERLEIFSQFELENANVSPYFQHEIFTSFVIDEQESVIGDYFNFLTISNLDADSEALINIGTFDVGFSSTGSIQSINLETDAEIDKVVCHTSIALLDSDTGDGIVDKLVGNEVKFFALDGQDTEVNEAIAFYFNMPFGSVGSDVSGFYIEGTDVFNTAEGFINAQQGIVVGSNREPTNSSVGLEMQAAGKAFLNARMTTAERDNLTAIDGMQIYNTTTDKLQVRAGGSWVDLH